MYLPTAVINIFFTGSKSNLDDFEIEVYGM